MNKKITPFIAIAVVSLGTIGIYSGGSLAEPTAYALQTAKQQPTMVLQQSKRPLRLIKIVKIIKIIKAKRNTHFWRLGLNRNKHLSKNDARTLVKAALLIQNRHDLDVGKIYEKFSPKGRKFYVVQIIDAKEKVVNPVTVDSANGRIRPMQLIHPAS